MGLVKFCCARTTPKPEFCIPNSIDIVLETDLFLKRKYDTKYPITKPSKCRINKHKRSLKPEDNIISFPWPIILATISAIKTTANPGVNNEILDVLFGKYLLKIKPNIIGNNTTCTVL